MRIVAVTLGLFLFVPSLWAQQGILTDTEFKFNQLHWLTGTWDRLGMSDQRSGIERWQIQSDSVYNGIGLLLSGSDTVFVEKLKIVIKDDFLYYVADVPENPEPVYFKLVDVGNNYFVSRNLDHDFPQEITYCFDGGELRTIVSNDDKRIEYRFRRREINH